MKFIRNMLPSPRGKKYGKRLTIWTQGRSAGKHLIGPVWARYEWHNYKGVRYISLMVGNPKVHYNWAFHAVFYFTGV